MVGGQNKGTRGTERDSLHADLTTVVTELYCINLQRGKQLA